WLAGEFDAGRRSAVLTTGPSATADMGELVTGVHGPGDVHVVAVTDA
ncbi:MAG: LUD domain-containing protein, partial [Halobacteriales archaeon]